MSDFWINHGFRFIMLAGILICLFFFSLNFYTGSVKKLDLIIKDLDSLGFVRNEVLEFDKFSNRQKFDNYGLSLFTHLFYRIPRPSQNSILYTNQDFIDQLSIVNFYRLVYKIVLLILILDLSFIAIMTYLFGQNIK
jgi:hypothetical protein